MPSASCEMLGAERHDEIRRTRWRVARVERAGDEHRPDRLDAVSELAALVDAGAERSMSGAARSDLIRGSRREDVRRRPASRWGDAAQEDPTAARPRATRASAPSARQRDRARERRGDHDVPHRVARVRSRSATSPPANMMSVRRIAREMMKEVHDRPPLMFLRSAARARSISCSRRSRSASLSCPSYCPIIATTRSWPSRRRTCVPDRVRRTCLRCFDSPWRGRRNGALPARGPR